MGRPRKQPQAHILIATDTGTWISPDGIPHDFYAGKTTADARAGIAKAMPQCWAPLEVDFAADTRYDTERWHGEDTETRETADV